MTANAIRFPRMLFLAGLLLFVPASQAQPVDSTFFKDLEYRMVGPYRGGRVTAVTGYPNRPHTFLMGATGGGVWKTTNAGQSWTNISDGFFGGGIGAIDVADSAPNVIYVGTGSACIRGNIMMGRGVYKSMDGGETWQFIGLEEAGQIGDIAVHPRKPEIVYVAALGHPFGKNEMRGVFKSVDGGQTWEKVLYVSDSTGAVDLAMNPVNPNELFASMWRAERKPWTIVSGSPAGGLYKTTDAGETWEKLTNGLPEGLVGKSNVTVSPANPDRVWAIIEAKEPEGGVYRSDDGGETWERVNRSRKLRQRPYYYMHIMAHPTDPNTVYALNTGMYKSTDGGETFERIGVPHGDVHALWINPQHPEIMVVGDDGGAQVTLDGGRTWSTMYNQPTAEFYSVTVDNQFPYRLYGPQQDNSTITIPAWTSGGISPKQYWFSVGGCETGPVALHPDHPETIYAGCYGGVITRYNRETEQMRNVMVYPELQLGQAAKNLKERFQWVSPIKVSPHDPDVVYHASQHLFRTTDGGRTWEQISPDLTRDLEALQGRGGPITHEGTGVEVYPTLFALTISPYEEGTIWVGTNDGLIHLTRDGGQTWTEITPEGLPRLTTVHRIEVSPHQAGEAFVAGYRYRQDDFSPYVYHTTDYGQSWERLTNGENGIPSGCTVRVVREDPEQEGLLYAGGRCGMFISFDEGAHWQPFQLNLPQTTVTDLEVHRGDLVLSTMGRSFWILDNLSPLRQLTEQVREAEAYLFAPRDAYLIDPARGGRGLWPEGPPDGAVIDYYFAEAPEGEVTLEILNADGEVLRVFTSDSTETEARRRARVATWTEDESFAAERVRRVVAAEERFADVRYVQEEEGPLPAHAGLNRFVWNLHTDDVNEPEGAVVWGYTGGVKVPPGTYRVRLTLPDGSTQTQRFRVRMDPRLEEITREELTEQFALAYDINRTLTAVYDAVRTIRSVRAQLKDVATRAAKAGYTEDLLSEARALVDTLSAIERELIQTRNESGQDPINYAPQLQMQLAYLYGYVAGPDGPPTESARIRYDDLKARWNTLQDHLRQVLEEGVSRFNARIEAAGMPPVTIEGAYSLTIEGADLTNEVSPFEEEH